MVRALAAEYQKFAAKQITIETTDFKTIHRSTQSLLKYNEMALQSSVKPVTNMFFMPYEPDYNHVVLMLKLDQMGRYAIDSSGFGNHGKYAGAGYAPQKVMDDGIDLGQGENSQYFHFDGLYTFVYVEDSPLIQARKATSSLCFTFRIYLMAHSWMLSDPDDDQKPRYIFAKADDANQQNGYACAMYSDGNLKFTWAKNGKKTTVQTGPGVITLNNPGYTDTGYTMTGFDAESIAAIDQNMDMAIAVFQIAIRATVGNGFDDGFDNGFDGSTDNYDISVDSAFLTQSPTPVITVYSDPLPEGDLDLDLFVGNEIDEPDDIDDPVADLHVPNHDENLRLRIGAAYPFNGDQQAWYKWHGGIQDFRIYRDQLLTDEDILFLFDNKQSIAGYPFGQIAIAGYTLVLPTQVATAGYSVTGYDSTGFDTGL